MKYIFSLILICLAGFNITTSFMSPDVPHRLFGSEINVWLYRGIWLFGGLLSVYSLRKEAIKTKEK